MPASDPRSRPLTRLTMAAAAIGLFLVSYHWGNQYKDGAATRPMIAGVLIRPARWLPGFELQDAAGQPFTTESFAEHWTLLSFGDPRQASGHLAITRMIEVRNRLAGDSDLQEALQIALAAPQQDLALARDFGRLSPALRLLSGAPGEIRRLRSSVGAPVGGADKATADAIPSYLIGPSGRLLALFPGAQSPASIASDLSVIAEHSDSLYLADG